METCAHAAYRLEFKHMMQTLDGRKVANALLNELKEEGVSAKLVVILVGADPASEVYVGHKERACKKIGMESEIVRLPADVSQDELIAKIESLNEDDSVNGIIVQLPLPKHIESPKVIKAINPYKDVDGFHAYNVGKMALSKDFEDLASCTPKGITKILDFYDIDVSGMDAVVIGRSNIVGKPMGLMLLNRNATVTVCHSRTKDLAFYTKQADLIVVAVGIPEFLKGDMIKEGAIIIDVGIHRKDGGLVGDVDFESVKDKVSAMTPVPGGVGPMTVACLLANTVTAAKKQARL